MKNTKNQTCLVICKAYKLTLALSFLLFSLFGASTSYAEMLQLKWIDLVPESERITSELMVDKLKYSNYNMRSKQGAVRPELNGKQVRIPGFIIPLEGDADKVTEFLLVPNYGSCVHTPPPPSNQIIYVTFPQDAPDLDLWDVVYLEGKMSTQLREVGMVEAGYHIIGSSVTPYQ
ncbi:Putative uncharacterized protein [Moritella viscosa]|uniref:Uncharacterized protein n=1 Tax=Moritella viscosa TaxID=80854 RepID=A0A090KDC2_9GAMM|nr:DUF3299 domain-containing protein [Moritella viscosa]CED61868.1 membrane protein [Moritella viscosa]SGZ00523.1 Putative uncharacterized protein [Moritella viscosa]SHO06365.1 Putative uncharacterized protein [Moritella viscosa]SHO06378.1 Putative uncharacterized protein [Moritella viscosa]SHO07245.1 Putative uncharacterized protein [Moritella viscosa]